MAIMTADVKSLNTLNISTDNFVYNIDQNELPSNRKFGGVSWTTSRKFGGVSSTTSLNSLEESRIKVLRYIFNLILQNLSDFKLWLLMGHSAFQPDNRISRYKNRKYWGSMKAIGVNEISNSGALYQTMLITTAGFKCFVAKELSELSVASVVKALSEEHCAYLAVLPESTDLDEIIETGWIVGYGFDKDLLGRISHANGLLLRIIGEFDDIECGFVAIGDDEELLRKIV